MLGSWVRAPASSPDDNLRIVVFFCLWCNYVATDKMSIIDRMQASSKYSFYRDMQSISTTNKTENLLVVFYLGLPQSSISAPPAATTGLLRWWLKPFEPYNVKWMWCNDVATDKMSIIDCMQASSKYSFYRDMQSISTTNKNGELVGGFLLGVTSGE